MRQTIRGSRRSKDFDWRGSSPSARVVVVEDELSGRESLGQALRERGFSVRAAVPADGLECVRRHRAPVVVLALSSSGQTLDLIRRVRGRFEPIPLPMQPRIVVAGTAVDDATAHFALRLGADAVLGKRVTERQLADAVETLARQGEVRAAEAPAIRAG